MKAEVTVSGARLRRWAWRRAARLMHGALRLKWWLTRPVRFGVSALAVTAEGRVLLVRHSYMDGWFFPGGGREAGEAPEAAVLRELREEIGMTAHGRVAHRGRFANPHHGKRDTVDFFLVEDVAYTPRPSLEIDAVGAFDPLALPEGTRPAVQRRIAEWREGRAPAERW